uniref:Beta-Casp domain-containing protein n=1 Tax=Leersia perrieri TaxID=77586 RepID=A0A0D9XUK5_9ORYZ
MDSSSEERIEGQIQAPEPAIDPPVVKKKTKMVRLTQQQIDLCLAYKEVKISDDDKRPKLTESLSKELLARIPQDRLDFGQVEKELMKKFREEREDILKQYYTKGYAEYEVFDDGEDDDIVPARVAPPGRRRARNGVVVKKNKAGEPSIRKINCFHLDHAASLPYFLEKTTFKGRVFMTHATKAIYRLLLSDYVKVSKVSVEDMLFDEQDILRSMDKIEVIDFHQTLEVNGIRFWCYTAGHVLGAAMFMVDIAGVRIFYTGDYSREEDRHLRAAEMPQFSPDICIIESTYGVQQHQPRHVREKRFTDVIHTTLSQGGRVLIPAFSLGRAQELLLILDEYWANHPELHKIPIYYASPLAKKCMAVYQTYINSMNERIRNQFAQSNPFHFKHIEPLNSIENFRDVGPSVVMASPNGLQSGLSRQLFDKWCTDKKNSCVIPGYVVEGTLAKTIINEPREVTLANGLTAPLHMQVHYISFSAHADFPQTSTFLDELRPPNIVLVHGEANEMSRLKQKLISQFDGTNIKVVNPKNCQSVEMYFSSEKMAKTIGRLAEKVPEVGESVSGLLVKKGFTYQIMAPEDLHVYTQLSTANITQRIDVPYSGSFEVVKYRLKQIYESVESSTEESDVPTLVVHERVTIRLESEGYVTLQWSSDPISDMVSDSVVAMVLNIGREGPKVVPAEEAVRTQEEAERVAQKVVYSLMVSLFGDVKVAEEGKLVISVDGQVAHLDGKSGDVECENATLKERIKTAFCRIQGAVRPIPLKSS